MSWKKHFTIGQIIYNTNSSTLMIYDGISWKPVSSITDSYFSPSHVKDIIDEDDPWFVFYKKLRKRVKQQELLEDAIVIYKC